MGDEIKVLATLVNAFADVEHPSTPNQTAASPNSAPAPKVSVLLMREIWPCLTQVAGKFASFKDISGSIGCLLSRCIPPEMEDEASVAVFKELCTLASRLISSGSNTAAAALVAVLGFLNDFVSWHGEKVEIAALCVIDNASETTANTLMTETGKLLEGLVLETIQSGKDGLGNAWNRDKEQGQGQSPFESKVEPTVEQATNVELLSAVFALLCECCRKCPTFLAHLPASPNADRDHDRLLNRAVESAVVSIKDPDADVARQAILFLKGVMEMMGSVRDRKSVV